MRLGIDVGGTFTDLALIDDAGRTIHFTKILTTPGHLEDGVIAGIEKILQLARADFANVEYIVHGTTIGTNALIERKGANVGLITTRGFRDVLEIARIERPDAGLYDMTVDLPDPLVPRYRRLEVDERIGADGSVVRPLDEASARSAAAQMQAFGVEAVAVSLLFSFRNPAHERRVDELLKETLPGVPVSLSCDIAPEFREFERTSTTVINAYLLPVAARYLDALASQLESRYGDVDLRIMQASGGTMNRETARSRAVHLVNSGPAGGALATATFGKLAGLDQVIGVDMGGTSFDVCLIVNGRPRTKSEGEFEGFPVKVPMIDVEGIGAGGGSLAWVDPGGGLNVGPRSAGADPGPACYGLGGERATVTDANLVLGRLNPDYFLGGDMHLHPDLARAAVERDVAKPLRLPLEEAAAGIVRVVNANMVRGIGASSTQKGFDPREFSLLAFGGAGPLHAAELAAELVMPRVVIPPYCSVFSAFGAVSSDARHDYVRTVALGQAQAEPKALESVFAEMEAEGLDTLASEDFPRSRTLLLRFADLRYEGQSYELTVPVAQRGVLTASGLKRLLADFHRMHRQVFAYGDVREPVEFVSLRVAAIGRVAKVRFPRRAIRQRSARSKGHRRVYFPHRGFLETRLYDREDLHAGETLSGPSLVEERTSTTVVPPGWRGRVDGYGSLILEPSRRSPARRVP
jgi:N-methylhydantoinase A